MPDYEAASLSSALLARKGDASAAGFVQTTLDMPYVTPVGRASFVAALTPAGARRAEAGAPQPARARPRWRLAVRLVTAAVDYLRRLEWHSPATIALVVAVGYLAGRSYLDVVGDGGDGREAPAAIAAASGTVGSEPTPHEGRAAVRPARPFPPRRAAPQTALPSIGDQAPPPPEIPASLRSDRQALPAVRPEKGPTVSAGARADDGYRVQLYALRTDAAVRRAWPRLQQAHADLFGDLRLTVERVDLGAAKGALYRLQAGLLESEASARKLCARAKRRKLECIVVRPRRAVP